MVVAYVSRILPEGTIDQMEAVMQGKDEDPLAKITGVIVPADWDRQGNVTGVSISAFDEEEYAGPKAGQRGRVDSACAQRCRGRRMGRRRAGQEEDNGQGLPAPAVSDGRLEMNKTRDLTLLILLVLGITFLLSLTFFIAKSPRAGSRDRKGQRVTVEKTTSRSWRSEHRRGVYGGDDAKGENCFNGSTRE